MGHDSSRPTLWGAGICRSVEAEILLSCARARLEPEHAAALAALVAQGVDEDRLLRMAGPHGLLPLLHRHLDANCPDGVSGATRGRLRERFESNARRNLRLTAELLALLRLFDAHGIVAVAFKGPLLAVSAYGSLSLRQFGDLDILVGEEDVGRARRLLISRGYRPQLDLTGAREVAFLRSHCEYTFTSRDGGTLVELHWRFAPAYFSFGLDFAQVRDRVQWVSLAGARVRSLAPEDLLLVLCAHGAKHCWERLEWICGVSEVIRHHGGLDWRQVMDRAAPLGAVRMLALGLLLAARLSGAPIPAEVLRRAGNDAVAQRLAAEVRRRLLRTPPRTSSMVDAVRFHLRARERLADRTRYCLRFTFAPTAGDLALVSLPRALFFLYYVLRPIRIAWKYGLRLANAR